MANKNMCCLTSTITENISKNVTNACILYSDEYECDETDHGSDIN